MIIAAARPAGYPNERRKRVTDVEGPRLVC